MSFVLWLKMAQRFTQIMLQAKFPIDRIVKIGIDSFTLAKVRVELKVDNQT